MTFVGDVEAVGFVDAREVVDRDDQEAARAAVADRVVERGGQHVGEVPVIELAGEPVEPRQVGEPVLLGTLLVDHAHDAERARRLAVRAREPAADVLDPQLRVGAGLGPEAIVDLVRHAGALVGRAGAHDRIETGLHGVMVEELGEGASARDQAQVGNLEHVSRVIPPGQRIAVDVPGVGHRADRSQDFRSQDFGRLDGRLACGVGLIGRRLDLGHCVVLQARARADERNRKRVRKVAKLA